MSDKMSTSFSNVGAFQWKFDFLLSDTFVEFIALLPEAAILSKTSGEIFLTNHVAQELFRYSEEDFLKCTIEDLVPERIRKIHPKLRADFFKDPKPRLLEDRNSEFSAVRKDGTTFRMESALFAIQTDTCVVAVNLLRDITRQLASEKQIQEFAFVDTLTNLPNRRYFDSNFKRELEKARRHDEMLGILFIDLDKFKPINDNFGHHIGDLILQEISAKLSQNIRSEDFLARVGGDEFILMLFPAPDEEYIKTVANRVVEACRRPIEINGHKHRVFASVGISTTKTHQFDEQVLIQAADKAMYQAKKQGGDCFSFA